jgi:hypothetical protein
MTALLALGVSMRWAQPGPADFTPLLAILAAVLVARFVIGARLTMMTGFVAAAAGAAWAAALPRWGFTVPTLAAILAVSALRVWVDRARST